MALEHGKRVNRAEKDKDLLQIIIGGTQCNTCHTCKEVSLATQFCPRNVKQFAAQSQYYNPLGTARADNSNASPNKLICHFFNNQGCKKEKCLALIIL